MQSGRDLHCADPHRKWKTNACQHDWQKQCICQVLCYEETCPSDIGYGTSLYGAFSAVCSSVTARPDLVLLQAYNKHQDVMLSPDDIWLAICLKFAKHVNENAEAVSADHMLVPTHKML